MPISLRARIYRSILKRVLKERVQTIQELRLDTGLKAMPPAMFPKGIEFESIRIGLIDTEWLLPLDRRVETVIVHFHGGGYVSGSPLLHRMLTSHLVKTVGARVLVPDYRLAPEHPFPAALEDALAVYHHLLDEGHDPRNIIFSGDSAGGGLALAAVLSLKSAGEPLPSAVILMSPWTDLELKNPSCKTLAEVEAILTVPVLREWAGLYARDTRLDDPLVSPVNGDYSGFPPMLIQVGSDEILLDDSRLLALKARASGVRVELSVYEGLWHVWQILGSLVPENEASFLEITRFIESLSPMEGGSGR